MMASLLEHMGMEKDRVQFSWISSAEATKFATVAREVAQSVEALGPNTKFVKGSD